MTSLDRKNDSGPKLKRNPNKDFLAEVKLMAALTTLAAAGIVAGTRSLARDQLTHRPAVVTQTTDNPSPTHTSIVRAENRPERIAPRHDQPTRVIEPQNEPEITEGNAILHMSAAEIDFLVQTEIQNLILTGEMQQWFSKRDDFWRMIEARCRVTNADNDGSLSDSAFADLQSAVNNAARSELRRQAEDFASQRNTPSAVGCAGLVSPELAINQAVDGNQPELARSYLHRSDGIDPYMVINRPTNIPVLMGLLDSNEQTTVLARMPDQVELLEGTASRVRAQSAQHSGSGDAQSTARSTEAQRIQSDAEALRRLYEQYSGQSIAEGRAAADKARERAQSKPFIKRLSETPVSFAIPPFTASGLSVTSRITRTGFPKDGASSCIPPESVIINFDFPISFSKSQYSTGGNR